MTRRRWFQLHLSTLLLLTIVAGGLVYLNVRAFQYDVSPRPPLNSFLYVDIYRAGWPFPSWRNYYGTFVCGSPHDEAYVFNPLINGVLLFGPAIICEYFIRHRKPPA